MRALDTLARLHISVVPDAGPPVFGADTALIAHVSDLCGSPADGCDDDCPGDEDARHRHFLINIGRGFLGILEGCCTEEVDGIRYYEFPAGGSETTGPTLSRLGKTGNLASVYLPARLGEPDACRQFRPQQHRLLQAIVREKTRRARRRREHFSQAELIVGNRVSDAAGRRPVVCPRRDPTGRFVTFGGNRKRRGCGYLLTSEFGWLRRAGYEHDEAREFLGDALALADRLGLIVVGLRQFHGRVRWLTLAELKAIVRQHNGYRRLEKVHVRFYVPEDYEQTWSSAFGWDTRPETRDIPAGHSVAELAAVLQRSNTTQKSLAAGIDMDASQLGKIMSGKRRCPSGFLDRAFRWISNSNGQSCSETARTPDVRTRLPRVRSSSAAAPVPRTCATPGPFSAAGSNLAAAIDYHRRGWSIIPQVPGTKKPFVRWTELQDRQPTETEVEEWWQRWPNAGIALIAGPTSGVLVVDVDGVEAHAALVERLGTEPIAPKVLSGSREPSRFHLFFKHPAFGTRAKKTPWHPKLEFRGHAGLAVLPPSLHKSGNRYAWADGRCLTDLELPELPDLIVEAIRPVALPPLPPAVPVMIPMDGDSPLAVVSPSTRQFACGVYSNGPNWNERLFRAACDFAGRGIPRPVAEPLLLDGARPWDDHERENARRTIESAYSQPRAPSIA